MVGRPIGAGGVVGLVGCACDCGGRCWNALVVVAPCREEVLVFPVFV